MENIVRIENLIFEYAGDENKEPLRAIKGISLDIEAGTFTAIIGRNGSGKSTLAKWQPARGAVDGRAQGGGRLSRVRGGRADGHGAGRPGVGPSGGEAKRIPFVFH